MAARPTGGNESQGVFAIADPYGDDFPIAFDPEDCIPLPNHPYTQGELRERLRTIRPGRSRIVEVGIRTHGRCATGSCSQSTLRVEGTFSGGDDSRACAGLAVFADTSVKSTNCAGSVNDCNRNGAPDADDVANGISKDQNFNGTPDECEQGTRLGRRLANVKISCVAFTHFCYLKAAESLDRDDPHIKTAGVLEHWKRAGSKPGVLRVTKTQAIADPGLVKPGSLFIIDLGQGLGHSGMIAETADGRMVKLRGTPTTRFAKRHWRLHARRSQD